MSVVGFKAIAVAEYKQISISATASGECDSSITCSLDPRTGGCTEINAGVGAVEAIYRVLARIGKAGGDA